VLATSVLKSQPVTVIKRRSKSPQTIPMTPVDVDGVKYLVSVRGETEWVKNVRANPHVKLTKSDPTDYVATEMLQCLRCELEGVVLAVHVSAHGKRRVGGPEPLRDDHDGQPLHVPRYRRAGGRGARPAPSFRGLSEAGRSGATVRRGHVTL
jgi:hypothetical protein